jgi:hypothetical protein
MLMYLFFNTVLAQDLPKCLNSLNKTTKLTTIKFEKVLKLSREKTVYKFSVRSSPKCMDCTNGSLFYDDQCNLIASFEMGRTAYGYVEYGYKASELGYTDFPNLKYGNKKGLLPNCVISAINKPDSLVKAGVIRLLQVRMKDQVLYCFEKALDPKLKNCIDCAKQMDFINEHCKLETSFSVGGIAGFKGSNGYSATDYQRKEILNTIWKAPTTSIK